jgi:hypothetical protein
LNDWQKVFLIDCLWTICKKSSQLIVHEGLHCLDDDDDVPYKQTALQEKKRAEEEVKKEI